ncbi:trans-2,3-dihydro-3-hydroxyanthranilate isomerase [Kushneria avicenniae]|uniref:Trans-2,3-dihydro-3-hydroxyanthranilate isomerase n=1 Tax=Kushneria avicenniae TaxID=402385 RepID=A0A1I1JV13_9GAMM|nr:PhzF family phenazine biosynthesis protein [Kushneria avicenniae]SFC52414.1 trans-2,3-dihydro-3-hydroxyanthranilate isomerase [Kushneria avicenniae]
MPLDHVFDSDDVVFNYILLDVFTETSFQGNPLAVFPEAGALNQQTMQRVARELNLSETVFVTATAMPGVFDLRLFTPLQELSFAGHPTIGTAWLLREIGWHDDQTPLVLREKAGDVPIRFDGDNAWLSTPELPAFQKDRLSKADAAHLLGLSETTIASEPVIGSCGSPFHLIELTDLDALACAQVDTTVLRACCSGMETSSLYLYVRLADRRVRTRMLAPLTGTPEDPATGSAAAPLAGYLAQQSSDDGTLEYTIMQGIEMGRPGRIAVLVDRADQQITAVHVGGTAVIIGEGRLYL